MTDIRLLSWNVNGLRAVMKKGFQDWIQKESPDILCLQETKAHPDQLSAEVVHIPGYFSAFASAEKKGYSGVAIYSKKEPLSVQEGLGVPEFDHEGRTLIAEYDRFTLFNIYFPNGKASPERLRYKMNFYDAFAETAESRRNHGQSIVTCGDVNTAHKPVDLARPRENENVSGFLPEERAWIDSFLAKGYFDTFREFNQDEGQYSWWDYKTRARERNIGWRIDYFFISDDLRPHLKSGFIMQDVTGSDHCPVGIELRF